MKKLFCDICNKDYSDSLYEKQEFTNIVFVGGYGSVFGDMDKIEIDICQHCLKEKLGKWIRVNGATQ